MEEKKIQRVLCPRLKKVQGILNPTKELSFKLVTLTQTKTKMKP